MTDNAMHRKVKEFRRKSMTIPEEEAFKMVLDEIIEDIVTHSSHQDAQDINEWIRKVIEYNCPDGKQIRGRGVVSAYRSIVPSPTMENTKLAYILGWCIEIFSSGFLLVDDIMKRSESRRNKPCWHLVNDIGNAAINDAFLINTSVFFLLEKHFRDKSYCSELMKLFHDIFFKTSLGQSVDTRGSIEKHDLKEFTMENYFRITKYKVCYFSFWLPIACARIMAGATDKVVMTLIEELILDMGHLYQVQDDYLDCFGNAVITGRKIGTYISENKCSWLIVKAYEKANKEQKQILQSNYGLGKSSKPENVEKVTKIFKELNIPKDYDIHEQQSFAIITSKIDALPSSIPKTFFRETVEILLRRNK